MDISFEITVPFLMLVGLIFFIVSALGKGVKGKESRMNGKNKPIVRTLFSIETYDKGTYLNVLGYAEDNGLTVERVEEFDLTFRIFLSPEDIKAINNLVKPREFNLNPVRDERTGEIYSFQ